MMSSYAIGKTGVVAHRGASGQAPENTLSAIRLAIAMNVDFVEIDVQMTKDGHVIAIHDSSVDRTTDSSGPIEDFDLNAVQSLDAGSWFDEKFKNEHVPTLDQILKLDFKNSKLIIEVKNPKNKFEGIEEKIQQLVELNKKKSKVVFKSFSRDVLKRFERLEPGISRLYVTIGSLFGLFVIDEWLRVGNVFDVKGIQYIQIHKFFLTKSILKKAKERKIKVIVWDVHDEKTIVKFIKMGVDFIETDFPDKVLDITAISSS